MMRSLQDLVDEHLEASEDLLRQGHFLADLAAAPVSDSRLEVAEL